MTVGFEKDANGQYVLDEWLPYGMTLFAEGGIGSLPRIFDTSSPGTDKEGDLDLGATRLVRAGDQVKAWEENLDSLE